MLSTLKSIRKRLPRLSPRFHIAFGLSSLVTSVVLLSMVLGFVPDRANNLLKGRIALAEAVSTSNSLLLKRNDLAGIRGTLEFIIERNTDLDSVRLVRYSDNTDVVFGAVSDTSTTSENSAAAQIFSGAAIVSVPMLRGEQEWGQLDFKFQESHSLSWLDRIRNWPMSLMFFVGLISLPMFYFYLGRMLKELNPSEAVPGRVRNALDTIAESLLVIDSKRNVVLANAAFAELAGTPAEELVGLKADSLNWITNQVATELVEGADAENAVADTEYPWQKAFETGEPTRMDMVGYTDKDGRQRKFIVNCSPVVGDKGNVGGVLLSLDDITLLEEKEILLRQSMEEAEEANRAKTAFLSNMSHEIRTPMTSILGFTEVLKRGYNQTEGDRLRHLNTISNSGTHLLELINDVLDLSKVESGAMEVESIPCKVALISHEVLHVLDVKAREKNISLDLDIETDLPEHIFSDPSRLRQVITNLVGNAIKFTDQGGVKVVLSYDDSQGPLRLLIKVSDSGIGMSEKQLATIFDAFTQADASITRRFGGTGLGLSISRQLAVAMGGNIVVSSEEGKGSTFCVVLPPGDIESVAMLTPAQIIASFDEIETVRSGTWNFPSRKALVVDDGPENRELLSVVLNDIGIDCETAENGQEGVDKLFTDSFDIVLMDIQMPVLDGFGAVKLMRERSWTKPVVALTANAMKGYEHKVLKAGFSHYMTKPIDLDRLTKMLAELLGGTYEESQHSDEPQVLQAATENTESRQTIAGSAPPAPSTLTPSVPTPSLRAQSSDWQENPEAIVSTLALQSPKFARIAEQFVVKLDEELTVMHEQLDNTDFAGLARSAHWLKGSGGTVGFPQFKEPALKLEESAKAANAQDATQYLSNIKDIRSRIQTVSLNAEDATAASTLSNETVSAAQSKRTVTNTGSNVESESGVVDNPIVSSLPMTNPRFRGIVERFIARLDDQIGLISAAIESEDFEQVAKLGHWLKGSGGNVGFSQFKDLGLDLENSAKEMNDERLVITLQEIEVLAKRIKAGWNDLPPLAESA